MLFLWSTWEVSVSICPNSSTHWQPLFELWSTAGNIAFPEHEYRISLPSTTLCKALFIFLPSHHGEIPRCSWCLYQGGREMWAQSSFKVKKSPCTQPPGDLTLSRLSPVVHGTVPQAMLPSPCPHPSPPFHLRFVHPHTTDVIESKGQLAECIQGIVIWILVFWKIDPKGTFELIPDCNHQRWWNAGNLGQWEAEEKEDNWVGPSPQVSYVGHRFETRITSSGFFGFH